jgi:perosamine synthetase
MRVNLPLILDLAHAHGAMLGRRHLSTYSDMACYSTHDRKILSTGEGGFVLTDDQAMTATLRSFIKFGHLNGRDFGLNFKLSGAQAALGTSRLVHLSELLATRRGNAQAIVAGLRHNGIWEMETPDGAVPSYYFMLLRFTLGDGPDFLDHLDRYGVPSDIKRYGCKPLYEFPALAAYGRPCPNATHLLNSVTTIPEHPGIAAADLAHMVAVINAY